MAASRILVGYEGSPQAEVAPARIVPWDPLLVLAGGIETATGELAELAPTGHALPALG